MKSGISYQKFPKAICKIRVAKGRGEEGVKERERMKIIYTGRTLEQKSP